MNTALPVSTERGVACSLYNQQIENLIRLGFHKKASMTKELFIEYMEPTRELSYEYGRSESANSLPFLLIPNIGICISEKMELIQLEGVSGNTHLISEELVDHEIVPKIGIPYILINITWSIEDGKYTKDSHLVFLKKQSRINLTAKEAVIAIIRTPDMLEKFHIGIFGSRFHKEETLSMIAHTCYSWQKKTPKLISSSEECSMDRLRHRIEMLIPSAEKRISL